MTNVEVKEGGVKGLGIFALQYFTNGEVIRRVNIIREVTPDTPLQEGEQAEHCAYHDEKVVLYGYPDRHMNHSCDPNCYYEYGDEIPSVVARQDIKNGEELTVDYLINNSGGDSWNCDCQSPRCRGKTGNSFFDLPSSFQMEYLPFLAPWFVVRYKKKIERLRKEM